MHFYTRFAAFAAMTIISVASIMAQTTQKWGNTALRVAAAAAVRQDSRTASADSIDAVQAEATASSIMEMPRISVADSLLSDSAAVASVGYIPVATIPNYYFVPAIFDTYRMLDADSLSSVDPLADIPAAGWLMRANAVDTHMQRAKQAYMLKCPESVQYNVAWLPEPPKKFEVVIDPKTQVIDIHEVKVDPMAGADLVAEKIDERHWMHQFSGNIQFSQAYVSPNWYQGGNNNLNIIAHAIWNVKLNQNYHPKLLFDTTIQYKLGMNSAPDDSLRNYSISEDLFQINSTFGVKVVLLAHIPVQDPALEFVYIQYAYIKGRVPFSGRPQCRCRYDIQLFQEELHVRCLHIAVGIQYEDMHRPQYGRHCLWYQARA